MASERLNDDDWHKNIGHIYRYQLLQKFIKDDDIILDIACGIGYGSAIIRESNKDKRYSYIGVDKINASKQFLQYGKFINNVDLNYYVPNFEWDISVCFETLEHLINPKHLVEQLKRAKKFIFVSVPTRPTKHKNKYHLHDFTTNDILKLFYDLRVIHVEDQPKELSHIFIFES